MDLRELLRPVGVDSVQVWHCEPLVIVDDDGVVAFAGRAEVEFAPQHDSERIGTATMTTATSDGWLPTLIVKARFERMDRVPDIRFGMRSGFTLVGEDEEGVGFTWHIDGAADLFLTLRAEEDAMNLVPPELLVIVNGEGVTVFAEEVVLSRTPSVRSDRISLLQLPDSEMFLETIDEEQDARCMRYSGTGPLDEPFTWYVGAGAVAYDKRVAKPG